jgi:hypothetical protein
VTAVTRVRTYDSACTWRMIPPLLFWYSAPSGAERVTTYDHRIVTETDGTPMGWHCKSGSSPRRPCSLPLQALNSSCVGRASTNRATAIPDGRMELSGQDLVLFVHP